jgi:hypothetical protein
MTLIHGICFQYIVFSFVGTRTESWEFMRLQFILGSKAVNELDLLSRVQEERDSLGKC